MASTTKSIALTTKRSTHLYKQLAQLSLMFIALLMMLALSAVLTMALTLWALWPAGAYYGQVECKGWASLWITRPMELHTIRAIESFTGETRIVMVTHSHWTPGMAVKPGGLHGKPRDVQVLCGLPVRVRTAGMGGDSGVALDCLAPAAQLDSLASYPLKHRDPQPARSVVAIARPGRFAEPATDPIQGSQLPTLAG
jgi:hypothetical protein